jgi:hypothetical protein
MGGFINSQADNEICEALNKRFSDEVDPDDDDGLTYLEQLRDHFRQGRLSRRQSQAQPRVSSPGNYRYRQACPQGQKESASLAISPSQKPSSSREQGDPGPT